MTVAKRPRNLAQHEPRLFGDLMLVTRIGAAFMTNRHPDQISRHAEPVACDTETHLPLYDATEIERSVKTRRRRVA